jgi:hypothetical protein
MLNHVASERKNLTVPFFNGYFKECKSEDDLEDDQKFCI